MKLTAEIQPDGELFLFVESLEDFKSLIATVPVNLRIERRSIGKENIILAYNIIAIYDEPEA
jgi:hypothetical protein